MESGEFGEGGEFGENGKFGENLPKGLTKNLGRRAPSKAANLAIAKKNGEFGPKGWLKGPVESDEFGESGKIWQNFVKGFDDEGENLPKDLGEGKGPRRKRQIWRKQRIWRKWRIWRNFAKGFDKSK